MKDLFNPVLYIDRHLEPPISDDNPADEVPKEPDLSSRPLGEVEYRESGSVELQTEEAIVYYQYHPIDWTPKKRDSGKPFGKPAEWRGLSDLVMLNKKSGVTTDIKSFYPESYDTIFRIADELWDESYHDYAACRVVISSPLLAPFQFAVLLHEIGHAIDKTANPYLYQDLATEMWRADRGDIASQSLMLMKERNAWAFALNTMRPFLSDNPRSPFYSNTIQDFIHQTCLQDYSDTFRRAREASEAYLAL